MFTDISINDILHITFNQNLTLIAILTKDLNDNNNYIHVYNYNNNVLSKLRVVNIGIVNDIKQFIFGDIIGYNNIIIAYGSYICICIEDKSYRFNILYYIVCLIVNDRFMVIANGDKIIRFYKISYIRNTLQENIRDSNYDLTRIYPYKSISKTYGKDLWNNDLYKSGFGYSLASDTSGDYLFVGTDGGAIAMNKTELNEDMYVIDTVYVYKYSESEDTYVDHQTLKIQPTGFSISGLPYSLFGYAISYSNNKLAISAPYYIHGSDLLHIGAVYIYSLNATSSNYIPFRTIYNTYNNVPGKWYYVRGFGLSISLNSNATKIAIGFPGYHKDDMVDGNNTSGRVIIADIEDNSIVSDFSDALINSRLSGGEINREIYGNTMTIDVYNFNYVSTWFGEYVNYYHDAEKELLISKVNHELIYISNITLQNNPSNKTSCATVKKFNRNNQSWVYCSKFRTIWGRSFSLSEVKKNQVIMNTKRSFSFTPNI